MKKMIAVMMTLVFAVLCCVAAQAEVKEEILFEGIPWGSDLETVKQAMLASGWLNQEGLERFEQEADGLDHKRTRGFGAGSEYTYEAFDKEYGRWIVNRDDNESANILDVTLMSGMVAKPWMGVEIHNIMLLFALDGDTEKLVFADVSLMVNREDLRPEFEKLYGTPDERNEEYRSVIWLGSNRTAVMYDETNVYYGLLDAKEIVDASRMNVAEDPRMRGRPTRPAAEPTPEPTSEPTPEPAPAQSGPAVDIMDYMVMDQVLTGDYTFLSIPWNSDTDSAADGLIAQGLIRGEVWDRSKEKGPGGGFVLVKSGDTWKGKAVDVPDWETYYFWGSDADFGMTCFGLPAGMITMTYKKDGDRTLLKSVEIKLWADDGYAVQEAAVEQLSQLLGASTERFGSYYWSGENDTCLRIDALKNSCTVILGAAVPEE